VAQESAAPPAVGHPPRAAEVLPQPVDEDGDVVVPVEP
jgi:hypothetical protein